MSFIYFVTLALLPLLDINMCFSPVEQLTVFKDNYSSDKVMY